MIRISVTSDQAGQRLDRVVAENVPQVSRSFLGSLIKKGLIKVNDAIVKPGHKLKITDQVEIDFDFDDQQPIPEIDLPIIYEDKDCIVINKPPGILTHSKGAFNPEPTVATFISPKITLQDDDSEANQRAGIVHRLDRATSGVIICSKHEQSRAHLQKQFSSRNVRKTYRAVVKGHLKNPQAIIDMPIERNPKNPKTFRAGHGGKPAITKYEVISSSDQYDAVVLYPETGRTHQLRVHMSSLGHPIVGDNMYGGPRASRLYLHAHSLEITLLNSRRQIFTAPLPPEFTKIIEDDYAAS